MKKKLSLLLKSCIVALPVLFLNHEATLAQDALGSVKINIQHVTLSTDRKTLSYDVYLQDNNTTCDIAVPGFLFRMAVPQTAIGTNAKTVAVTNTTSELGATAATMIASGDDWLMKFKSNSLVSSYGGALLISETFPGTRIGTFNITNTDGTAFSNPLTFDAIYSGDVPTTKTFVSVFVPNTTTLASNSTEAQPSTSFSGLGIYNLSVITPLSITAPTLTLTKVYDGTTTAAVTAGTLSGVISSDKGNVTVHATATYGNSTVGTGKTITTKYTLGGSAAQYYKAPDDYSVTTGEITAAPLTINTPSLTLTKIYDGTTSAAVKSGALSGVFDCDLGNVDVNTTANYADANAGAGKKITVAYALTGANAANYAAPADYVVTTGEIDKRVTVKAYMESLWNSGLHKMTKCKSWDDGTERLVDKFSGDIADTLRIELHKQSYNQIAYTLNSLELHQDGAITSTGSQSINVPVTITGSYYIAIKGRNGLETVSASVVSFDGNSIDYDFTDSPSKAFESDGAFSPTKQIGDKWGIYAGDVLTNTASPEINELDFYELFNKRSAKSSTYGYSILDLNGDGEINETDIYMAFSNRNKYLYIE